MRVRLALVLYCASTTTPNTWSFEGQSKNSSLPRSVSALGLQSFGGLRIPDLSRRGIPSHDRAPEVGLIRHVAGERSIVAKPDIFG